MRCKSWFSIAIIAYCTVIDNYNSKMPIGYASWLCNFRLEPSVVHVMRAIQQVRALDESIKWTHLTPQQIADKLLRWNFSQRNGCG